MRTIRGGKSGPAFAVTSESATKFPLRFDMSAMDEKPREVTSFVQLAYRFGWIFLGPSIFMLGAIKKFENGGGWLSNWNAALLIGYGICVVARAADIRWGFGTDTNGQPVTPKTWPRYVIGITAFAFGAYLLTSIAGAFFKR
jgi:hypothetical protein